MTNAGLFLAPVMLRWVRANSIRTAVKTGFMACAILFSVAGIGGSAPELAITALFLASLFLILLDLSAGLPFLMAVRPSERTEMSAVYSSYRDVSGIVTPGIAWIILQSHRTKPLARQWRAWLPDVTDLNAVYLGMGAPG